MGFPMQWPRVRLPPYVVPRSIHTVGAASLGFFFKKKKSKFKKGEKGGKERKTEKLADKKKQN